MKCFVLRGVKSFVLAAVVGICPIAVPADLLPESATTTGAAANINY